MGVGASTAVGCLEIRTRWHVRETILLFFVQSCKVCGSHEQGHKATRHGMIPPSPLLLFSLTRQQLTATSTSPPPPCPSLLCAAAPATDAAALDSAAGADAAVGVAPPEDAEVWADAAAGAAPPEDASADAAPPEDVAAAEGVLLCAYVARTNLRCIFAQIRYPHRS
jgi:hypothetical protein